MKVALIGCSKIKQDYSCSVEEMYSKPVLFSKSLKFCILNYEKILILSAYYGILERDDFIAPYDVNLQNLNNWQKQIWIIKCYNSLFNKQLLKKNNLFSFYTGNLYYEKLGKVLKNIVKIELPLKGLGIGKRLQYFNEGIFRRNFGE